MTLHQFTLGTPAELDVPTYPSGDVTTLGRAGGRSFASLPDGTEIVVGAVIADYEMGNPPLAGEVHITRRVPSGQHVGPTHVAQTIRAVSVPAGSYAAAVAKDESRARQKERAANPPRQRVDMLAPLPLMRHDPGQFLSLAPTNADNYLLPGRVIGQPGRPAARGAEDIIARLAAKGVTVEIDPSGRYVEAWAKSGRIKPDVRELLGIAEPLLRAHLAGAPLLCPLGHRGKAPAAVTLVEPSAMPVCGEHADEERA